MEHPELPHSFRDPALLELALTHASAASGSERDNERLEFLGDAALDLVVADELFACRPRLSEGEMTERKAWVVSRATLAEAARDLGLQHLARFGGGLSPETLSRSVLANLYEAVLGAVYLDAGLDAAREFVMASLAEQLGRSTGKERRQAPKQTLQELCQRRWGQPPEYELLEKRGRAHAQAFRIAARAGGHTFPDAWGRTRKEAESWAAHEALLVLSEDEAAGDGGKA